MTEYLASFIEPEAVSKIRKSREEKVGTSDSDFSKILSNTFGRPLGEYKDDSSDSELNMINIDDITRMQKDLKVRAAQDGEVSKNYKFWTGVELP